MDAQRNIRIEQLLKRLWQVAVSILALSLAPLGLGLRFRVAQYILIGAYMLALSLFIMLVATSIWAFRWIKKNVKVE